jgi:UDP-N-acetyl-D-glucosamine dehydrogenase
VTIGIIGLGYVGLPLALLIASRGKPVIGYDVSSEKVGLLLKGKSYIEDIPADRVLQAIAGSFSPTSQAEELKACSTFVICVPTPLDGFGEPDLSAVISATHQIYPSLKKGDLVILESTTSPGTTREVVLPILELSGLKAGSEFHLSYSPERVDPRNSSFTIENTPKLVAGLTKKCVALSVSFYSEFVSQTVPVSTLEEAEMAKLVENAYRFINISFINELSVHCARLGINVWNVIEAASTKPYGFQKFEPGPGVGGHCIPVDPIYLSRYVQRETGSDFQMIAAARRVNQDMPREVFEQLMKLIADVDSGGVKKVLLVGVGYKAGVNDIRQSPAEGIASILIKSGFIVEFYDSYVSRFSVDGQRIAKISSLGSDYVDYAVIVLQKIEGLADILGQRFDPRLILDLKNNTGH